MKKHTAPILITAYVLIAAWTYGYVYNVETIRMRPDFSATTKAAAEFDGVVFGFLWPLYWPFHISKCLWMKEDL